MTIAKQSALLIILLLLSTRLFGLDSDSEQPIAVEADSLEVREHENISIYQGNVTLVQGSLQISSDRLVIHFNDDNELVLMEMTGAPARLRQLDNERKEMRGEAATINYTESESLLELRGDARFDRDGDSIEGNLIRINTGDNSIEAGSSDSEKRVKMLIKPRPKSTVTE